MSKTNHRRGYTANQGIRAEYRTLVLFEEAPDGTIVGASATGPMVDHCCGKHGAARGRAGAKKFVHSRVRRRTREWLKEEMARPPDGG